MATSVNGNKLILTARGFKRVNEKTSPELKRNWNKYVADQLRDKNGGH